MNQVNTPEMDIRANKTILNYSLLAGSSSLLTSQFDLLSEFDFITTESLADTAVQYQMVTKLAAIYQIDNRSSLDKFVLVILDNISWSIVGDKLIGIVSKFFPGSGTVVSSAVHVCYDFISTLTIGHVYKQICKHMNERGVSPSDEDVRSFIGPAFAASISYVGEYFLDMLNMGKIKLEKYPRAIDDIVDESKELTEDQKIAFDAWIHKTAETLKNIRDLSEKNKDFDFEMDRLKNEIQKRSTALILAELRLKAEKDIEVQKILDLIKYDEEKK